MIVLKYVPRNGEVRSLLLVIQRASKNIKDENITNHVNPRIPDPEQYFLWLVLETRQVLPDLTILSIASQRY